MGDPVSTRISDLVFASRSGETPIVGYRKMWLRIAKLGDLPADITPHVLRHSFASLAADLGYSKPTIASLLGHNAQHHQQVCAFCRCRVAGSSRCCGECHHEADDLGSSATPVAGSAARWISRVGRKHLFIGVFVPRAMMSSDDEQRGFHWVRKCCVASGSRTQLCADCSHHEWDGSCDFGPSNVPTARLHSSGNASSSQ